MYIGVRVYMYMGVGRGGKGNKELDEDGRETRLRDGGRKERSKRAEHQKYIDIQ